MIRQLEPSTSLERSRVPKDLSGLWFVAPFFLLFAAFGVFALLFTLFVSFQNWDPITGTGEFGFRGLKFYGLVLSDPIFWSALLRSLAVGLPGIVLQHLIALPLAFAMHLVYRNTVGRLGTLFFLPYIASPVAISATLGLMYSIVFYPINDLLGAVHSVLDFVPRDIPSDSAFGVFSQIWTLVGWNVLLYLMALSAVPRSVLEAAQLDGAGFWRQLTQIVIPIVRPMIFVAFSMSVMQGLQTSTWSPQFENPESVKLPAYINQTAFLYTNFGMASAQTWLFFAALMLIVGLAYAMFGRNFTALETPASLESDHAPLRLSPVTTVIVKILIGFGLVSSIYPIALLFFQATQTNSFQATTFEVGPDARINYLILLDHLPTFWRNLWNAVYVSGLASLGAIITSALAGFAFASLEFRFKRQLFAVVMGAMLYPAISSAIPYLMEMRILDWIDTPKALWVPASFSALGVFLVRQFTLNAVPQSTLEAARIDGANDAMMFWHIAMPLMKPVLSTVGLLTFVTTWNHIEAASLLMRSDETRLLSQALNLLVTTDVFSRGGNGGPGGSGLNSAVIAAAIGSIPPLLIYAFTAGNLGRGLGIGGTSFKLPGFKFPNLSFLRREPENNSSSRFDLAKFDLAGADGVRAIACLMVVFSHLGQRLNQPEQTPFMQTVQAFLMKGSFGVSAFFVLSGMLLSLPFWTRYLEGKPFPNLLEYARRRFLRIAPGFYASLIVVFLIARATSPGDYGWLRLLSGLTFTTAFHWITLFPVELNGPLWSIGFEVVCYALMPLFMIGLFALSRSMAGAQGSTQTTVKHLTRESVREDARGTTKTITRTTTRSTTKLNTANAEARGTTSNPGSARVAFIYWIGVLILAILAHGWIVTNMIPDSEGRGWDNGLIGGAKYWMPNYNVVGLFSQYCIGVLTAGFIAYRRREIRNLEPAQQRNIIFDRIAISAGILALALMFALRGDPGEYAFSLGAQPYAFPTFAILVALVLACTPFSRSFRNVLDNTFFKYTAKLSFGLYIWHYAILEVMRIFHNSRFDYFGISNVWQWLALCSFALIAAYSIAGWSYTHIESPFLRTVEHEKKASSSLKKSSVSTA
jgi:ABC-type glycerol-3-phosphate transport system permease component/peptidoglycan/LPS O-acetylase OafA/YrhL